MTSAGEAVASFVSIPNFILETAFATSVKVDSTSTSTFFVKSKEGMQREDV